MRLTKYHKKAVVAAIMQDVPKPARDFDEEHRKAVKADMIEVAAKTNPALAKALADKNVFSYLVQASYCSTYPSAIRVDGSLYSASKVGIDSVATYADYEPSPELKAFQAKLMQEALAVHIEREALEAKVAAAINACTTRKTVLERMPEFEKYLPKFENYLPKFENYLPKFENYLPKFEKYLPKFEKYLPEEPTTGSMLPVVANLAADLVKAGWPKGKVSA